MSHQNSDWEKSYRESEAFCRKHGIQGSAFFKFLVYDRDWEAVEQEYTRQVDAMHKASKLDSKTKNYIREESAKDGHPIAI